MQQASAIINRILNHKPKKLEYFQDVNGKHTFAKDIAAIKELGVINCFPDETFRPNEKLTRAQMAVIVKNEI
ncbi:S-layer homology domain-containing protein [Peribacillus faecalis]|uniref:S-layer homology domain-containing protein n=1 Tax=Peribacillus faecalis TaxID=2772559 RepID=UPI002E2E6555|nr:S-layer homology domain-containing protein [Peribacillus faecalis]